MLLHKIYLGLMVSITFCQTSSDAQVPGIVINHRPAADSLYIGSPSICTLQNGTYIASHEFFGPGLKNQPNTVHVFASRNKGKSWQQVDQIRGQTWSQLFAEKNTLYLLGPEKEGGDVVIRQSTDGGHTWSNPQNDTTGRLLKGRHHCAPTPVVVANGRIWKGMEDVNGGGGWGKHFRSFIMSAPLGCNYLDARNWTTSNVLGYNASYLNGQFGGWLESNAVPAPDGHMVMMLRTDYRVNGNEKAAIIDINPDGKTASFHPETGFIDFPGGCKKFAVRYDSKSRLYWSLANYVPEQDKGGNPERTRNTQALLYSSDLYHWQIKGIVLHHDDVTKHGFQYMDFQFDGSDIIAVSRTAYDDANGGADNQHNANYLTFHRIHDFRHFKTSKAYEPLLPEQQAATVQLTYTAGGHTLNSTQCVSPDDNWIVYDTRNYDTLIAATGCIAMVNVHTKEIRELYHTSHQTDFGPGVGAATFSPAKNRVLFLHGIRDADKDHPYSVSRRTGVAVDIDTPFRLLFMDARNITPPFTRGALRGGTHAHSWSGDGQWISFTYNDYVMETLSKSDPTVKDLRTVGVMFPGPVTVPTSDTTENNSGAMFAVIVTSVTPAPKPGSDEIDKAFDESWIGVNGYLRPDGSRQRRAITFQGNVRDKDNQAKTEVFVADLPDELTTAVTGQPLEGKADKPPGIPAGVQQRRITFTANGIQGPRHWLRTTPDGSLIAFLAKDTAGFINIFAVSPNGGAIQQLTFHRFSIQGSFNFSPDGSRLAYIANNTVYITQPATHRSWPLTTNNSSEDLLTGAVTWLHNGKAVVYNRYVKNYLQIFLSAVPDK
ncbi:DUF3748 domain-containing protein [Chitinophaga sp. Ak27]|uniref:DUF3748 domain-containing protein n=1 Tax=Chitinophaga sp. Ak27 TaxID=2726116 RepID=UPI001B7CF6D0|nr:DUF3748 domain-containing protein [Chitinophaga sp. Ak27]